MPILVIVLVALVVAVATTLFLARRFWLAGTARDMRRVLESVDAAGAASTPPRGCAT